MRSWLPGSDVNERVASAPQSMQARFASELAGRVRNNRILANPATSDNFQVK